MGVAVRMAHLADAAALHELAAATFAQACPPGTLQEDIDAFIRTTFSVARFTDYLIDENRELLVAETDGELLGYTMLVYGEPGDADAAAAITARPTVELSKIYVRAEQHGKGIAAALLAATIDTARQRGSAGIWLGVNQQNERANRFYEKNRFELAGTKRFLVGEVWHDDFVREYVF